MAESPSTAAPARALPQRVQLLIVLAIALGVVAAIGLKRAGAAVPGSAPEAPALTDRAPGAYRPTPGQLSNLKVKTVAARTFQTEFVTEGQIAVNGDRTTPVYSPYSGRVTRIVAAPGDLVRPGAPLFSLEASEFVQGQNDLAVATAALNTARAQLKQAEINEQRKHGLVEIKAGAVQDWQQAQAELAAVQETVRSAEVALAAARNRLRILGKSPAEIAALERAGKVNPVATVAAPIGGTVIERQVGVGQYIQTGASDPQYRISDLSSVWLVANVRESDAPLMKRGAAVDVRVLALPGKVFKAKVGYVAPRVDPATRRLAVRAEIPNADGALKPDMFATFTIAGDDASTAVGVQEEAVLFEGDTARVWVLKADGTLELRPIRAGRNDNGTIEVLSGLSAGEQVVTSGSLFIDQAARHD